MRIKDVLVLMAWAGFITVGLLTIINNNKQEAQVYPECIQENCICEECQECEPCLNVVCDTCEDCPDCPNCPPKETVIVYPHNGTRFADYIIDKLYPLYSTMLIMSNPLNYEVGKYDCTQYSRDFVLDLRRKGIESVVIRGKQGDSTTSHAMVGVIIEPQRGEFVKINDGYTFTGIRLINKNETITNIGIDKF